MALLDVRTTGHLGFDLSVRIVDLGSDVVTEVTVQGVPLCQVPMRWRRSFTFDDFHVGQHADADALEGARLVVLSCPRLVRSARRLDDCVLVRAAQRLTLPRVPARPTAPLVPRPGRSSSCPWTRVSTGTPSV